MIQQMLTMLRSPRTTLALLALVVGINGAYLLRHGSTPVIIIAGILLAIIATGVITGVRKGAWEKTEARQNHQAIRQTVLMNAILAGLAAISAHGALN